MGNTVKFTEPGTVTVQLRELRKSNDKSDLCLTIKETGIGIPASRQSDIFNIFIQVDTTTARQFGGTGLGLSICREISQKMGGHVCVCSGEGEGTTFAVYFQYSSKGNASDTHDREFGRFLGGSAKRNALWESIRKIDSPQTAALGIEGSAWIKNAQIGRVQLDG